jgi:hypothetical protein
MKKTVTYSKDAHLHIRVDKNDLRLWKADAKKKGLQLTAMTIRALNRELFFPAETTTDSMVQTVVFEGKRK